jgi:hypothetical protein
MFPNGIGAVHLYSNWLQFTTTSLMWQVSEYFEYLRRRAQVDVTSKCRRAIQQRAAGNAASASEFETSGWCQNQRLRTDGYRW